VYVDFFRALETSVSKAKRRFGLRLAHDSSMEIFGFNAFHRAILRFICAIRAEDRGASRLEARKSPKAGMIGAYCKTNKIVKF
jgi:hypothetical protein